MNLKSLKHINNFYLVILAISVFGFLLRLLGLNWDQGNLFHPDERQLLMISQRLSINDLLASRPNLAASLCLEHTFFLDPSFKLFSISLRIWLASFDLE